ncbi:gliding motility-associated ABC transporter permease subunit GldF [Limibacter armeniacum]|uniref:gliding motility-associated ABC transporter permease subunit GldF n=1 Tax=Limibacter armeniacum TaxID=466084 RepID=UPI002FE5E8CA
MLQVLLKEVNSFLSSLAGYIVILVFLIVSGLFSWVFPNTSIPAGGFANLQPLFSLAPYIFMFLIPAITMRSISEEKRTGTLELLLTRPLSDLQIITGKYLACLVLVIVSLIPTFIYYYSVYQLGTPQGNIDTAAVIGSYIGLFFLGATFTAIGILASSLTDNQIVAFIISLFFCFLLYDGFTLLASVNVWADYSYILSKWGIDYHYRSVSKGLIDSRNVLYFLSIITIMLSLAKLALNSRKWE